MSDAGLIAILLAAFLLAIGLVRLLGRLVDSARPAMAGPTSRLTLTARTQPAGPTAAAPALMTQRLAQAQRPGKPGQARVSLQIRLYARCQ